MLPSRLHNFKESPPGSWLDDGTISCAPVPQRFHNQPAQPTPYDPRMGNRKKQPPVPTSASKANSGRIGSYFSSGASLSSPLPLSKMGQTRGRGHSALSQTSYLERSARSAICYQPHKDRFSPSRSLSPDMASDEEEMDRHISLKDFPHMQGYGALHGQAGRLTTESTLGVAKGLAAGRHSDG